MSALLAALLLVQSPTADEKQLICVEGAKYVFAAAKYRDEGVKLETWLEKASSVAPSQEALEVYTELAMMVWTLPHKVPGIEAFDYYQSCMKRTLT